MIPIVSCKLFCFIEYSQKDTKTARIETILPLSKCTNAGSKFCLFVCVISEKNKQIRY